MTKSPFGGQRTRVKELLGLIHTDVCGPMSTISRGGFSYFITFTDDYSRFGYVYLMKKKSETFEKFKEFKNEVEKQTGKSIKALRSDRGGEYLSNEFIDYLNDFTIETAGEMKGGKEVFVVGKLNQPFTITDDDKIDQYISFVHGHNGKRAIQVIISPIRMFCTNQVNLMLSKATFKYSVRHSGDVKDKLNNVQMALNEGNNYMETLTEELFTMASTRPSISVDKFTELLFPVKDDMTNRQVSRIEDIHSTIIELYNNKPDNQNYKNTELGYINAVSDYLSHRNFKKYNEDTKKTAFFNMAQNNTILDTAYQILRAA